MHSYVVIGVRRDSGEDFHEEIRAANALNAKVKAELAGVIVTEVRDIALDAATRERKHTRHKVARVVLLAPLSFAIGLGIHWIGSQFRGNSDSPFISIDAVAVGLVLAIASIITVWRDRPERPCAESAAKASK